MPLTTAATETGPLHWQSCHQNRLFTPHKAAPKQAFCPSQQQPQRQAFYTGKISAKVGFLHLTTAATETGFLHWQSCHQNSFFLMPLNHQLLALRPLHWNLPHTEDSQSVDAHKTLRRRPKKSTELKGPRATKKPPEKLLTSQDQIKEGTSSQDSSQDRGQLTQKPQPTALHGPAWGSAIHNWL